jgi:hypothetical protein
VYKSMEGWTNWFLALTTWNWFYYVYWFKLFRVHVHDTQYCSYRNIRYVFLAFISFRNENRLIFANKEYTHIKGTSSIIFRK